MSRYVYDTDHPPAKAFEAVEAARDLIRASGLLVSGAIYLASADHVTADEEPVAKPDPPRWVTVRRFQPLGGQMVADNPAETKVVLHVTVDGEKNMASYARWHAAMHDRIARALIGKTADLTFGEIAIAFRQITEPSAPQYDADTDTRMSFSRYAVTLHPNQS